MPGSGEEIAGEAGEHGRGRLFALPAVCPLRETDLGGEVGPGHAGRGDGALEGAPCRVACSVRLDLRAGLGEPASLLDVPGVGRIGMVTDPSGAKIGLMTPAAADESDMSGGDTDLENVPV